MGHSQADKARSRERILSQAAEQIRDGGLQSLSVAKLMRSANLTHGGFYGHIASRSELLAHALATTPDDRLNWAPSATARTPIQLVAHSASAVKAIHSMLAGNTVEFGNPVEADRGFREWERRFDTREQVLRLLEESSAAYIAWLDTLTPDHLQDTATLPFGLGTAPVAIGLTFAPNHLLVHKAQIDYIQTIYGDHDWHM